MDVLRIAALEDDSNTALMHETVCKKAHLALHIYETLIVPLDQLN